MAQLGYSMQDWFLRIAFAPSCAGEGEGNPIAEMHDTGMAGTDFDVVVNSKWLATASERDIRVVLAHECNHAIEGFLASRRKLTIGA